MQYVVCYSGGHSSALAAVETVRRVGNENVILLNHDISSKVESIKIKKFKNQVAEYLQLPITYANCEGFEQKTPLSLCLEHGRVKFRSGHEICTYFLKHSHFTSGWKKIIRFMTARCPKRLCLSMVLMKMRYTVLQEGAGIWKAWDMIPSIL